jgi:phthalate 4,5-cis-dihydrodiol dehydrogenase
MITALNFTDFLYRPRRSEELSTAKGGGIVFSQGTHHVDIVRYLAAAPVASVRAAVGAWDPARPTEGAYSALLSFADGTFASLVYSGYAHFDSDELGDWIGELGRRKDPQQYGAARRRLDAAASAEEETAMKHARSYGGESYAAHPAGGGPPLHEHFGLWVVSCERADLRPLPTGVMIYDDRRPRLEPLAAPAVPRVEVIDELYDAVVDGGRGVHDGAWALGTLEVCLAILRSAREGREISLDEGQPAANAAHRRLQP